MSKAVFGIVTTYAQAESIVDSLKIAGFSNNDISVLLPDKDGTRDFAHEKNTKAPEGAAAGAGTGGVVGGVLGWLVGIGSFAIPGVGPFVAAGPIMAALSGAAVGSAVGGLTGALVGLGNSRVRSEALRRETEGRQHSHLDTLRRFQRDGSRREDPQGRQRAGHFLCKRERREIVMRAR